MIDILSIILNTCPLFIAYQIASIGHSVVEKSGVLNLAIDGLFVLAISVSFMQAVYSGNDILSSILLSIIVTLLIGLFIVFISTKLPVSQGAIGLSIMFICYGLAGILGVPARSHQGSTGLKIGFNIQQNIVYSIIALVLTILLTILIHMIIEKTKLGIAIRACGENPLHAEALGVNVLQIRLIAGAIGYGLIGLSAGLFELLYSRLWREGHGMGHGWIVLAISLSSGRNPLLCLATTFLFSTLYEYRFSLLVFGIPREFIETLPYIVAILSMIIYKTTPLGEKLKPPQYLGKPYFKEERTI
ncbi:MAG: ABC transporter permease [Desulfurococcaceae archaeon]